MKVLLLGVFTENSNSISHLDAFLKNDVDVITYDFRQKENELGSRLRDDNIISLVNKERPDMVLFPKCNEINIRVVHECNKITTTVLWYMDPLNSNFNNSLIEKIKHCNYVFCALWEPYLRAKEIGGDKVHFLHEGFDHINNYPIDTEYKYDVTFIGNLRGHRKKYYDEIKFNVINDAYSSKHSKAVSATKINLNFTHGGTSDRTYKVLASKGFLLTEPWDNMGEYFTINKDLVIFNNVNELKEKIEYYLNNESERITIANNGFNTVQKFSRINWAKEILKWIK